MSLRNRAAPTRSGTASVLTAESRWKTTSTARLLKDAKEHQLALGQCRGDGVDQHLGLARARVAR